jgi:uncharacterized protein YwgA
MNNSLEGYAAALELICKKRKVGKKAIQKFMYLMERKGVEFDLDYKIHFFGPYSVKLTHILHALESRGVIDIDTSGRTHTVSVTDCTEYGEGGLSCNGKKIVEEVLSNFGDKSALELEGIATLDYVACNMADIGKKSDNDIINSVKRIKGTKFSEPQLYQYLEILKEHEYLS